MNDLYVFEGSRKFIPNWYLCHIHTFLSSHTKNNSHNHQNVNGTSFGPLSRSKKNSKLGTNNLKASEQQQCTSQPQPFDDIFSGPINGVSTYNINYIKIF